MAGPEASFQFTTSVVCQSPIHLDENRISFVLPFPDLQKCYIWAAENSVICSLPLSLFLQ